MSTLYFQFNEKQYNFKFYFHFIFNTKQLKFNLKLTNLCRFDEWQLSATIHISLSCFSFRRVLWRDVLEPLEPGATPRMKGVGMLIVSLSGVNFGVWSHFRCSGQNAIIFSREGLV